MAFFRDLWAVILATATAWISHIDNEVLNIVVNLLTIAVILIGLADWAVRKIRGKKAEKKKHEREVLTWVESTQRPFRTVTMLDNPMGTSEMIIDFVDKMNKPTGGKKMKKFFKWVWYNKEQLLSIAFNTVVLALTNVMIFTNSFDGFLAAYAGTPVATAIKIGAAVLGVLFTALTIRNVCVKYGLSSLATIDAVLAERAADAATKLTPEQKKQLKSYIATLETTRDQTAAALADAEKVLADMVILYNADPTLVPNYNTRKAEIDKQITHYKSTLENVDRKIGDYKAQLAGKKPEAKA